MFGSNRPPFSGTSTFSGFGSTNQQSTGFGTGTSAFGRAPFGSQATSSGFGIASTSAPFGSTTNTGSSLFGSAGQTGNTGSTVLFGSQAPGAFSAKPGGFTTATSSTGTSLFGTQNTTGAASTGLFGSSTTNASNAFGTQNKPFGFATPTSNTTGGGLFSTSSSGGLFGSGTGTSNVVGTTVKYQPVTGSDTMTRNGVTTNIQTRIEVITCMKEYENKSLEELRVEDYLANRKGPGQGGGLMTGAFGQNTGTTGGLFGSSSTGTGGLFGQKPAENKPLFGSNTGFAAVSSSGGGLFGTNTTAPAFGQAAGTSTSTGGFTFGQNTQQNKPGGFSFMSNNNTTSGGGLFGQQQQTNTGFGAPNTGFSFGQNTASQQTGGLFNQPKPAFGAATSTTGGGLFGSKPASTPAFGGLNTSAFGATSTASPFGATTSTSGGLFGNTQNKPAFGLGTSSAFGTGSAFNTGTNTSGGGLFGNLSTNTGAGLFSNTANQNKPAGGLAFNSGSTFNTGSNSLGFGFNSNANKPTGFGGLGTGFGTGGGLSLGGNIVGSNTTCAAGIGDNNIANLIKALTDNPFGHSSLLKTPATATGKADELPSPPSNNSNKLPSGGSCAPTYVLPANKSSGHQPRANPSVGDSGNLLSNRSLLFSGLDDTNESNGGEEIFKTKTFPSVKKLNLKVFNNGKNGVASSIGGMSGSRPSTPSVGGLERGQSPLTSPLHLPASSHIADTSVTPDIIKGRNNMKKLNLASKKLVVGFNDTIADLNVGTRANGSNNANSANNSLNGEAGNSSTAANVSNANYTIFEASSQDLTNHDLSELNAPPHPTGIKLSRSGYYTIPSLSELASLIDEDGQCIVENFSVGREGYGNVCFTSETNVIGLDLDSIVFIVRKEVEVYPDGTNKPNVGEELNKPAVITLDAVWPIDKSSRDVIKDADRLDAMGWPQYLEKKCFNMGAKFLEYRPDTGSWVFKVGHFSKYGLEDDSDEFFPDDILKAQQQHQARQQQQQQQQHQAHQLQQQVSALDALPRKTNDSSLIKSTAGKAYLGAASSSHVGSADGGEAESPTVTSATPASSGSLSATSSGLGGGGSPTANGGGPPTQGLLSPPPIHHLLPAPRRLRDSPSHLQQQGLPSSSGSSLLRSTAAAAAAPVPGEMFLDSFANEPHEGASLGLSCPGGAGVNLALQQLTANLFPMEEDEDVADAGDGYGSSTVLHDTAMELTLVNDATTKRSAVLETRDASHSTVKKFAGRRLELSSSVLTQDMVAGGASSPVGRLSPSAGEQTLMRPKHAQLAAVAQQITSGSSVAPSYYRAPRTDYPELPSGGGAAPYPSKVAPQYSSTIVPLHSSAMEGQHRNLCDLAAFMGRRSRVGWGPSFRLLHTGQPLSTQVDIVAAAASAEERRLKRNAASQRTAAPYLFMPANGATSVSSAPLHSLPDMPEHNVRVERLHLTDLSVTSGNLPDPAAALVVVEACLHQVLRCSTFSQSSPAASAPLLLPSRGRTLLHRLAATVPTRVAQSDENDSLPRHPLASVFELCMALWGKLDYSWLEEAAESSAYVQARARVETVSMWLENSSSYTVLREVHTALRAAGDEAYLDAVFSLLTDRSIQNACELLQEKGDHQLALLLAQACMGDDTPRQIVAKQLSNWAECSADATFSPTRLLLFVLAAGKATHTASNSFVNLCKGLDWRRSLAVHLWYVCPSTCTVGEALAEYERGAGLLTDEKTPSTPYCQHPLPQYLAEHTLPDSASRASFDICYHLLKLYTDSAYRLDQLLNPAAITPDPLDVTASWLVMVLIYSLGYDRVNPVVSNGLHLAMAAYLESVGLWHWAVFALLSLKEEKCRSSEVRALLCRHIQILEGIEKEDETFAELHKRKFASYNADQSRADAEVAVNATDLANYSMEMTNAVNRDQDGVMDEDVGFVEGDDDNSMDTDLSRRQVSRTPSAEVPLVDESLDYDEETPYQDYGNLDSYEAREAFVISHLKIPETWINESKAILARSFDMIEEEAWYLIKAGNLDAAHKLFVDSIAPDAIINENHEYLQRFITAFEASSDNLDVKVSDWKIGGAVFAHYLHVLRLVDEIKSSQQPSKDKVEALRPRLLALCSQLNSLRTPTAKHRLCVSEVSRVVVGVLRAVLGDDLTATTAVANQIASLPLSKDCALQELNTLTHQYLSAVAS